MTQDEILQMAREAGINFDPAGPNDDGIDTWYGNQYLPNGALLKFSELVAAKERHECAQLVAKHFDPCEPWITPDEIRARGQQ